MIGGNPGGRYALFRKKIAHKTRRQANFIKAKQPLRFFGEAVLLLGYLWEDYLILTVVFFFGGPFSELLLRGKNLMGAVNGAQLACKIVYPA